MPVVTSFFSYHFIMMTTYPIRTAALAAALLCLATAGATHAQDTGKYQAEVAAQAAAMYPRLDAVYKDLHAHPELGFQEVRTAAKLAAEMRALGFQVTEKVGRTGVVAIYKNGLGPTVMVRTELDGLPMEEKSPLPYASKSHGVFMGRDTMLAHSCGHDVHMTTWLGTARTLVAMKSQWKGTLMFIGQPSEEGVSGAQAMLDDGLFTRFGKPDLAFALHTMPQEYDTISYVVGPTTSNADAVEIVFKGRGGHGSGPDKTIDPIAIAAHFIADVQTVVSREKDPMQFGVVTIGAIEAGTVGNIIPDQATLRGTIRSYDAVVRKKMLEGVRRTAQATAMMAGAPEPEINMGDDASLAVISDEALVNRTVPVLENAFGKSKVMRVPPFTGSEDFSVFINQGIPSMMFFTGVYDPKTVAASKLPGGKPLAFNHSPYYAPVAEPSIKLGVQAMSLAVLNVLAH